MRLIIAGGRNYQLTETDYARLEAIRHLVTRVVCGGCSGADECGKQWAIRHGIDVRTFPANTWQSGGTNPQ